MSWFRIPDSISRGQEPIFSQNTLPLYFLSRTSLLAEVRRSGDYTLEYLLLIRYYAICSSPICSRGNGICATFAGGPADSIGLPWISITLFRPLIAKNTRTENWAFLHFAAEIHCFFIQGVL
jgi:hypothetical protein